MLWELKRPMKWDLHLFVSSFPTPCHILEQMMSSTKKAKKEECSQRSNEFLQMDKLPLSYAMASWVNCTVFFLLHWGACTLWWESKEGASHFNRSSEFHLYAQSINILEHLNYGRKRIRIGTKRVVCTLDILNNQLLATQQFLGHKWVSFSAHLLWKTFHTARVFSVQAEVSRTSKLEPNMWTPFREPITEKGS